MTPWNSISTLMLSGLILLSTAATAEKPVLALVIDDLGYSYDQARQVFELPGRHTYAIIPATTYSRKIAHLASEQGHEIMLHMPMQSSGDLIIEPTALHDGMTEQEITRGVEQMISELPNIRGVNNHMGSKLTEIGYIMRPVMETIHKHNDGYYFLDSRTTAQSQAYQHALRAGLRSVKRDVFLDFQGDDAEVTAEQFDVWLKKARDKGYAVAIAHPYHGTIELLKEKLAEVADDFRFMTISDLIQYQQQESLPWPRYLSHLHQDSKNSKQ